MTYVIADVHGDIDRFHRLLADVPIRDSDTLYILGDIIDRGPSGVDILREIQEHGNFVLLKGNHEQMCLDTLGPNNIPGAKNLWHANGGYGTYMELTKLCSYLERGNIIEYLLGLPEQLEVTANERKFILVHAAPGATQKERLWARPNAVDWDAVVPDGAMAIIGHTPTKYLHKRLHIDDTSEPDMQIYFGEKYICIDCGCGNDEKHSNLGCLRLDDMAAFYVH